MKDQYTVTDLCEALAVSQSGYYKAECAKREPCVRSRRDDQLRGHITRIHAQSRETYGAPRVHQMLKKQNEKVSRKRVARLMREAGIEGVGARRRKTRTTDSAHGRAVAPNRLLERPGPCRADEVWVADITYIGTDEGWLYLAAVKDLYSRRVVGWATSQTIDTALVLESWRRAVAARRGKPCELFHSDRGSQYASEDYAQTLADCKVLASMSRRGNCYDNACMESGWGTLKNECIYRSHFATREQARLAIFEYMNFYNHRRLHSALGYKSPVDFENQIN